MRRKTIFPFFSFCPYCGSSLSFGGDPPRPRCGSCGYVQYLNPTVGVAVVLIEGGKILLGKRNRPPFAGLWCIPCGHVEWGEDVREAARREFLEETGLEVEVGEVLEVLSNFHNPLSLTVGVWFWGRRVGGRLRAGDDLDEVGFFPVDRIDVPLAFPTDEKVIKKVKNLLQEGGHEDAACGRVGGQRRKDRGKKPL